MRQIYTFFLYLLTPLLLLWLWMKPGHRAGMAQRLGNYSQPSPVFYWIHAASVGEVLAARPLIEAMLQQFPQRRILVTTFTATGAQFVHSSFGHRVQHTYLPLDLPLLVNRFLDAFTPHCAIFLETELWPNAIAGLKRRQIPVMIANGRLSPKNAHHYARMASLFRPLLARIDVVAAQSEADAARYAELGVSTERLQVLGNLKYDLSLPDNTGMICQELQRQWAGRLVWLAASTRDGEEEKLLELYPRLSQSYPQLLLVLVPRHPQRFDEVAQLVTKAGLSLSRRSQYGGVCQSQVYLGDSLGELPGFYAAADVVFMGGSLVPMGGHNPLEAAAVGKSVIVGPHTFNFEEVYQQLEQQQAMQRADSLPALAKLLEQQLGNVELRQELGQRAQAVMEKNRGGVRATLGLIASLTPGD